MNPKITLDQWAAFRAIVEAGSYAAAAERLHKSQSTLSYAVGQIESLSGVKVFSIEGRKAVLTAAGQVLYRQARRLVEEAQRIEQMAGGLAAGWEPEIACAVEVLFPAPLLMQALEQFAAACPQTRLELIESVRGGTAEALLEGRVDFAIGPIIPQGFTGERVLTVRTVAAAHPQHALHLLGRPLSLADLRSHRHLVLRETGARRGGELLVSTEQRWTVGARATWIRAACMGLGFAWFPEENIREELRGGQLKILPLREGADQSVHLYLIYSDPDAVGPAASLLAGILRQSAGAPGGAATPAPGE